jgi:hypothetical protein
LILLQDRIANAPRVKEATTQLAQNIGVPTLDFDDEDDTLALLQHIRRHVKDKVGEATVGSV